MGAIDSMHEVTGLPWWASIVSVALGVRVAMLPVSLKGIKASGGALALLRQAREEASGERTRSEGEGDAPTEGAKEDWGAITRRFHQLRRQNGVPSPLWVVGSPLLQLPIFITAMGSIRAMSLSGWPGFSTGGAAWFPDLTQPAVDFAAMTAPMGKAHEAQSTPFQSMMKYTCLCFPLNYPTYVF